MSRKGMISKIYGLLITSNEDGLIHPLEKWEIELNQAVPERLKKRVMDYVHSTSKDTKVKEMNYKLLTKWYYVPTKMYKINHDASPLCWRECGEEGNHAHIWWQCSLIQTYWVEVLDLMKQIEGKEIELDPWKCLFHAMGGPEEEI